MPTLSERASKDLLSIYGMPLAPEHLASSAQAAGDAADSLGYPVVAKLCGDHIAHKTERGLVKLQLRDRAAVEAAAEVLLAAALPEDEAEGVLVAPMVSGNRELIAGLIDDPLFGRCVMVGIGGVLAEALADVVFRMAPITEVDAQEMIDELRMSALLGEFRGEPAVNRAALVGVLMALSHVAVNESHVLSVDVNPLIVSNGMPIAVDALVEVA